VIFLPHFLQFSQPSQAVVHQFQQPLNLGYAPLLASGFGTFKVKLQSLPVSLQLRNVCLRNPVVDTAQAGVAVLTIVQHTGAVALAKWRCDVQQLS
jgi:hypothetical protein